MTKGGLMGKLIAFSLPLAMSGILQLLFNAADLVVIGQFSETGSESLAAVSSNNALIGLIINVAIGLSLGANVVMSQAIGAGNAERAERTVHTSLLLALICGVAVALVGALCARDFLVWMKTDAVVLDKAALYLRIYFIGAPANVVYNFGAAILRAKGDTRRPLVYLLIAGVLNAGLNLIFVIFAKLDVAGVALATIISQYVSVVLVIIALLREKGYCRFIPKKLAIRKRELLDIVRVGLPSGILNSFFSIANVIIQSNINVFGYQLMAGNSTGSSLEMFVYTAMNAVSNAATTFSGQNVGAKRNDRINSILADSSIITAAVSVVMGGFVILLAHPLASLYSRDPVVIGYAVDRLWVILPLYAMCGIVENFVGCLRGMNYSISPMIPCFICVCVYRIVWVFTVFQKVHTPFILYLSYPISWALNLILIAALYIFVYMKKIRPTEVLRADMRRAEYNRCPA